MSPSALMASLHDRIPPDQYPALTRDLTRRGIIRRCLQLECGNCGLVVHDTELGGQFLTCPFCEEKEIVKRTFGYRERGAMTRSYHYHVAPGQVERLVEAMRRAIDGKAGNDGDDA